MHRTEAGWQILGEALLVRTYSIGPGNTTNSVVCRLADGGLGIISPPSHIDDAALVELADFGVVRAIIAPNAYHTAGLQPWQERFPEAGVYAGEAALKRIRGKIRTLDIAPVTELATAEGVALVQLPRMRNGETFLRARAGSKTVWYGGDVFLNMTGLSGVMGFFFRTVGMGPGFVVNPINRWFMMRDRAAVSDWAKEALVGVDVVIPGHGEILEEAGLEARMVEMLG